MRKLFLILSVLFLLFVLPLCVPAHAMLIDRTSASHSSQASGWTATGVNSSTLAKTGMLELGMFHMSSNNASSVAATGWTNYDNGYSSNNGYGTAFIWHCFTAGDADPVLTWTGGSQSTVGLEVFWITDSACPSNPIDYHQVITGNTANIAFTSHAPSTANSDYVYLEEGSNSMGSVSPIWQFQGNKNWLAALQSSFHYQQTAGTATPANPTFSFPSGGWTYVAEQTIIKPATFPQYEAIRGVTFATGSAALNVAYPPVQANDAIVAHVLTISSATATSTGFTVERNSDKWTGTPGNSTITTLCKTATGSESGNFSVAATSGSPTLVIVATSIVGSQCTPDSQAGRVVTTSTATPFTLANVTPTVINDLLTGVSITWAQFGQVPSTPFWFLTGDAASPQPFTIVGIQPTYESLSATAMVANANGSDEWLTSSFAWLNTRPAPTPKTGVIVIGQ